MKAKDMEPIESRVERPEDLEILNEIEDKVIKKIDLGFDPEVLKILDDEEITKGQIEPLRDRLSKGVVTRLFGLGNSIYYGRMRAGKFTDFSQIILRLGLGPSKIYIISLALFFLKPGREFADLAARSFLISFLGKMLGRQMGFGEEDIKKVEMGGLFLKIGKIFMLLYEHAEKKELDEEFISRYYPYLGLRAVKLFGLPDFLNDVISFSLLRFEEKSFSISSVIDLAHSAVDKSFKKFGRFVIQSPMPDGEGVLSTSPGFVLANQLDAVGLGSFLEVVPHLSPQQRLHSIRKAQASK
jgi:hypothetical protein